MNIMNVVIILIILVLIIVFYHNYYRHRHHPHHHHLLYCKESLKNLRLRNMYLYIIHKHAQISHIIMSVIKLIRVIF